MRRITGIRRLFHVRRDRAGIERAVNDELQFHFDMTMRDLMANGMTPDEARKEAERRFGDVQRTRERLATIDRARVGKERRTEWWDAFSQDARYALRGLRLKPGFALAVILTLGLGIGANATMFGIVDRLLFRPPAYLIAPERASRLYLSRIIDGKEFSQSFMGYRRYLDLKQWTTSFDAMTPFYANKMPIGSGETTREMTVGVGAADLWKMFDVKPVAGRFFTAQEDVPPDGQKVAVLSYGFWQTQFGGRKNVLGEKIDIGPFKYTIVGVAPEGFNGFASEPVVAFVPISAAASTMGGPWLKGGWHGTYQMTWFETFARRKAGVSPEAATADLTQAYVKSYLSHLESSPRMTPLAIAKPHGLVGPVLRDRGPNQGKDAKVATWLGGVAGIVLLIACANVANLLLARALKRRREIAVRVALGVSRVRLMTQLLTESLLLAVLGGLAGIAVAQWGGKIVRTALLNETTGPSAFADPRLLLFAGGLALLAGLLTGLAPAFHAGRTDISAALKAGSREGNVHRSKLRLALLIGQAALSVVLLVGAGLFVRSLANVKNIRLGYDADQLIWAEFNWRGSKIDSLEKTSIRKQVLARAQQLPEVETAARALTVPFWQTWSQDLYVEGIDSVSKLGEFTLQAGTPEFFQTMGTRLIRGRGMTAEDRAGAPRVTVVGEAMAKRLWPNQDALGKCLRIGIGPNGEPTPCYTVVGIAEDVRRGNLTEADYHYYLSIEQFQPNSGGLFIRTRRDATADVEKIRKSLQSLMPGVSYVTTTPMSTVLGRETRSWKLGATMFAVFGALALVLAAIGLYSVIAYNVTQRTHEMGVRVALGAQGGDVVRLIVREGIKIVLPGVLLGGAIALFAGKWIAPLLFDVSPKDPPVLVGVMVTLIGVAIMASWVPALRASRVDPNEALRAD
jgi:putative ABC transport system permease protein